MFGVRISTLHNPIDPFIFRQKNQFNIAIWISESKIQNEPR